LDADLAALFGVPTRRLNEQIRRNRQRFPDDFAFILNPEETQSLMSQIATSNTGRGGRRKIPFVITEHRVEMAANVINSSRAVMMSVEIVRAFIRLRWTARAEGTLKKRLTQLERAVKCRLDDHDAEINRLFKTVEALLENPAEARSVKRIGFIP
jgi:hypothetical protein